MSSNVPAVSDVFLRPIRKNAKRFYGRKKMWRSKTHKGRKPDWVLRSLAAVRWRTLTDLLGDGFLLLYNFIFNHQHLLHLHIFLSFVENIHK